MTGSSPKPSLDPRSRQVDISVVVPCYRSGSWLPDLVDRLTAAMEGIGRRYEIVLVNDASPDVVTWPAIEKLATSRPAVVGIDLMGNVGQFRALLCGLEAARGSIVVTMDDDLQHAPEEVKNLVAGLESDPTLDAVVGSYRTKRHSWHRNLGTRLMAAIYKRSYGKPKDLKMGSFRAMRRPLVDAVLAHRTVRPVFGALILQSTTRIANIDVEHHPRAEGSSGWRLSRLAASTLDTVVHATTAPLRFVSLAGIVVALLSVVLAAYYLARALFGTLAEGFPTIVLLVIFFGGATLASVGLLGEYVVRIVTEVTAPPRYVVRERIE